MKKCEYAVTKKIAEKFDEKEVPYYTEKCGEAEKITSIIPMMCRSDIFISYFCNEKNSNIRVYIHGLLNSIADESRARAMEVCNTLNKEPLFKFIIDDDGDLLVVYDTLAMIPEDAIGELMFELFAAACVLLNTKCDALQDLDSGSQLQNRIRRLRKMLVDEPDEDGSIFS